MGVLDEPLNEAFLKALEEGHSLDEDVAVAYGLSVETAKEIIGEALKEYIEAMPDVSVERSIAEVLLLIKPGATLRDFLILKAYLLDAVSSIKGKPTGHGLLEPTPDEPVIVLLVKNPEGRVMKVAIQAEPRDLFDLLETFAELYGIYKNISVLIPTEAPLNSDEPPCPFCDEDGSPEGEDEEGGDSDADREGPSGA